MKQKGITLLAITIVALLTISFFIGNKNEVIPLSEEDLNEEIAITDRPAPLDEFSKLEDAEESIDNEAEKEEKQNEEIEKDKEEEKKEEKPEQEKKEEKEQQETSPEVKQEEKKETKSKQEKPKQENTKPVEKPKQDNKTKEEITKEQKKEKEQIIAADNENKDKKDKYLTDPVPEGKPKPVEWQGVTVEKDKELTATLSVTAKTILNNMHLFNNEKLEVLPTDGVIYPKQTVTFYQGESVFDVLVREMKKNGIHMEFVMTPIYNSHYVEGINNLYEFDCGELSGWMYKVNGWFPNYGASRYQLKDNDVIEWVYTCDLGRDIGGYGATTGGAG